MLMEPVHEWILDEVEEGLFAAAHLRDLVMAAKVGFPRWGYCGTMGRRRKIDAQSASAGGYG